MFLLCRRFKRRSWSFRRVNYIFTQHYKRIYKTASHCTITLKSGEHTGKIGRTEAMEWLNIRRYIDFKAKEISRPGPLMLMPDNVCLNKTCLLLKKGELKGWLNFDFHKSNHTLFEALFGLHFFKWPDVLIVEIACLISIELSICISIWLRCSAFFFSDIPLHKINENFSR